MATLPPIDFQNISATAKAAVATYGTPAEFILRGQSSGRTVRAVIYKDGLNVQQLLNDADSNLATGILNPDDFKDPNVMPVKFDMLRINIEGFIRTYTITSVAPITAQETLPLILIQLRAN